MYTKFHWNSYIIDENIDKEDKLRINYFKREVLIACFFDKWKWLIVFKCIIILYIMDNNAYDNRTLRHSSINCICLKKKTKRLIRTIITNCSSHIIV